MPGTWLSAACARASSHDAVRRRRRSTRSRRSTSARTRRCRRSRSRPRARRRRRLRSQLRLQLRATLSFRTPTTPLPMEFNPRKVFQRLFGQGDTPEERERARGAIREHARHRRRANGGAAEAARRRRPRDARRLPRDRARDRAPRAEDGGAAICRTSTCPTRRSASRSTSTSRSKLMFDLDALAYQANLTRVIVVHHGGRGQQP